MKLTIITKMLPILLFAVVLISCEDKSDNKESYPLTFEKGSYEVALTRKTPIMVRSGSRDYSLSVKDPEILDAEVDLPSLIGSGNILVTGKKKGETILSVTDNLTKETVELNIKVIDNYLSIKVGNSNHPTLAQDIIIYMINNEARNCCFVSGDDLSREIVATGRYEFSVEEDAKNKISYLTFTYALDEKGHFTDAAKTDATIAPTPHKFDISGNKTLAYEILSMFLDINWEKLTKEQPDNSLRSISPITLKMKEVGTEYEITGIFWSEPLPDTVLKIIDPEQ